MKTLENKVSVITGAASGMGLAMAKLFAKEGSKVVVADLNEAVINEVAKIINSGGGVATSVVCNVTKEDDIKNMIETAVKTYGSLDILINNAGIMDDFMPVENASTELWNKVMNVNINGPFYACHYAVPFMLKQGRGVIINNTSIGGLYGGRAGVAYTASKHALVGLTKNIGFMYAKKGIRCNAIAPGAVNTNIGQGMKPDKFGYETVLTGMGTSPRTAEPNEVAEVALFLASDKSGFVNGTVITADGGWTAY